ncbi:hypothetical protein [Natrinema versiforme]|uniref:Uncharacterized protein n=1 Tax=Natrinema versiforme TaxID=88724 RepID=A0A4P8WHG4_9EURY|nr:hypothetical protein [Natrinema versiforme]QCS42867.1 hypothetical protein FEJ81_11045 [Natrinema versiforme]
MSETVQVNLRVEEERKDEWQEYVSESDDFQTLTDLIRVSVSQQMRREEGKGVSQNINVDLDPLKDEMGDIRNVVKGLSEEIDELRQVNEALIEESQQTRDSDSERYQTVLSHVPNEKKTSSPTGHQVSRSTAGMIAEETGYNRSAVDYYLEIAVQEGDISKDTVDGVVVYWKGDDEQ